MGPKDRNGDRAKRRTSETMPLCDENKNVSAIRVWLNNVATSRLLVNPAVILILETTVNLNCYLFLC